MHFIVCFYIYLLHRIRFNGNKVPGEVAAATEGSSVAVFLRNVLFFTGRFRSGYVAKFINESYPTVQARGSFSFYGTLTQRQLNNNRNSLLIIMHIRFCMDHCGAVFNFPDCFVQQSLLRKWIGSGILQLQH